MKTKNYLILFASLLLSSATIYAQMGILSGPKQASYYHFVEDISKALDGEVKNIGSSGAAYNFNQLVDPKSPHKVAMMQSDYLYFMQAADFKNNTQKTKTLKHHIFIPDSNNLTL